MSAWRHVRSRRARRRRQHIHAAARSARRRELRTLLVLWTKHKPSSSSPGSGRPPVATARGWCIEVPRLQRLRPRINSTHVVACSIATVVGRHIGATARVHGRRLREGSPIIFVGGATERRSCNCLGNRGLRLSSHKHLFFSQQSILQIRDSLTPHTDHSHTLITVGNKSTDSRQCCIYNPRSERRDASRSATS